MGCELSERERKERGAIVQVSGPLHAGAGAWTPRCFRPHPAEPCSRQVEGVGECIHESIQTLRALVTRTGQKELLHRFLPGDVDQLPVDVHRARELAVSTPRVRSSPRTGDG